LIQKRLTITSSIYTACLIKWSQDGISEREFATKFNLGFMRGPYFDFPGTDFIYFINQKYEKRYAPLFQRLQDIYHETDDEKLFINDTHQSERVFLIGKILGFPKACVMRAKKAVRNYGQLGIFVYIRDRKFQKIVPEIFAFTCHEKHDFMPEMIQLLRKSRKYLEPLDLVLGFETTWYP
jgi:hypothetical protein